MVNIECQLQGNREPQIVLEQVSWNDTFPWLHPSILCVCPCLQLIHPINALDELCHSSFVHPKPGTSRSLGADLIPISSDLCYLSGGWPDYHVQHEPTEVGCARVRGAGTGGGKAVSMS